MHRDLAYFSLKSGLRGLTRSSREERGSTGSTTIRSYHKRRYYDGDMGERDKETARLSCARQGESTGEGNPSWRNKEQGTGIERKRASDIHSKLGNRRRAGSLRVWGLGKDSASDDAISGIRRRGKPARGRRNPSAARRHERAEQAAGARPASQELHDWMLLPARRERVSPASSEGRRAEGAPAKKKQGRCRGEAPRARGAREGRSRLASTRPGISELRLSLGVREKLVVRRQYHDRNRAGEIVPTGIWTPSYRSRRGVVWELDSARCSYQAPIFAKGWSYTDRIARRGRRTLVDCCAPWSPLLRPRY